MENTLLNLAEHLLGAEGVDDAMVDQESRRADVDINEQEPATGEAVTRAVRDAEFQVERIDKRYSVPMSSAKRE